MQRSWAVSRIIPRENFVSRDAERSKVTLVRLAADEGRIELLHDLPLDPTLPSRRLFRAGMAFIHHHCSDAKGLGCSEKRKKSGR